MATENIVIGFKPVDSFGQSGLYHKYILYTDSTGHRQTIRGGPIDLRAKGKHLQ